MEYYKPRPDQPAPIQPVQPAPSNSVPSTPVAPTPAPVVPVPAPAPAVTIATAPVLPSQPIKRPDGQRDYKYTQEISQMVRASPFLMTRIPTRAPCQMFVFGEIQDPNHETVNLVEDIVRGQLIELVRNLV